MPDPTPSPHRPARADWRQGSGAAAGGGRGGVRTAVFITLLAVAGGIAGLWFWVKPPTPPRLLTVPVSEYTDPAWPANPWAERDSELLRAAFPDNTKAYNFQERERLVAVLAEERGSADGALVLHLTALARTRGGAVYLLPGHAVPDDPATWLPLADILAAFANCPAKDKLLLLDVARPTADPYRGPLADDVADTLHAQLTKAPPGFLILCSCGPGEFSLPMDDAQASAFAYYAARALAGAADGYNPTSETDGRTSAREMAAFVTARVGRWAKLTGRSQTPTLYGTGGDFPLTFEPRPEPEPDPTAGAIPPLLADSWRLRDDARTAGAHRRAPAAFARLEATLLRAERAAAAGLAGRVGQWLPADLDGLRTALDIGMRADPPVPVRSLVAARLGRKAPPVELVRVVDKQIAISLGVPPPKPEELQKALAEFTEKASPQALDAAGILWDRLLADPEPTALKVRELAGLVDKAGPPVCEELLLLRRMGEWRPRSIEWPAAQVHALLRAEDASGRTLGLLPAAFPHARAAFAAADDAKRDGERRLLAAGSRAEAQAAATVLGRAEEQFTSAARVLEALRDGRQAVADAAVTLTDTAAGMIAGTVDDRPWRAAADAATALADLLTRPPEGGAQPAAIRAALNPLRGALTTLEGRFAPAAVAARVAVNKDAGAPELQALRDLLASPLLSAPDRKAVWDAARRLSGRLHAEVLKLDQADEEAKRLTPAPQPAPLGAIDEAQRARRRVSVSAALLRLAGVEGTERLAAAPPADSAALAEPVRDAWMKLRPAQLAERLAKSDWPAADRLCRGPAVAGATLIVDPTEPPASRLHRLEERACREWLEKHYEGAKALRGAVRDAAALYDEAIAECRR